MNRTRARLTIGLVLVVGCLAIAPPAHAQPLDWPPVTSETKPWSRWWWMGSAVDPE